MNQWSIPQALSAGTESERPPQPSSTTALREHAAWIIEVRYPWFIHFSKPDQQERVCDRNGLWQGPTDG
ncbi:MAG: hypothetical protein NZ703_06535 [Gemmataceae bacterium]|nr:hypothetical protein [Gemmataceae bacterium]MCS7270724.1 hypothetical protein [Gemmataceae bacterium]MDW8243997.1 hypothetical protein [Thermogemmata sp.]